MSIHIPNFDIDFPHITKDEQNHLDNTINYIRARFDNERKHHQKDFDYILDLLCRSDERIVTCIIDYLIQESYKSDREVLNILNRNKKCNIGDEYYIFLLILRNNQKYKENNKFYLESNRNDQKRKRKNLKEKSMSSNKDTSLSDKRIVKKQKEKEKEKEIDTVRLFKSLLEFSKSIRSITNSKSKKTKSSDYPNQLLEKFQHNVGFIEKKEEDYRKQKEIIKHQNLYMRKRIDETNFTTKDVLIYTFIFEYLLNYIRYTEIPGEIKDNNSTNNQLNGAMYQLSKNSDNYILEEEQEDNLLINNKLKNYKTYLIKFSNIYEESDMELFKKSIYYKDTIKYSYDEIESSLYNFHLIELFFNSSYGNRSIKCYASGKEKYKKIEDYFSECKRIRDKLLKFFINFDTIFRNIKSVFTHGVIEYTTTINGRDPAYNTVICCYLCGLLIPDQGELKESIDKKIYQSDVDHIIGIEVAYITGIIECPLNFIPTHKKCNRIKTKKGISLKGGRQIVFKAPLTFKLKVNFLDSILNHLITKINTIKLNLTEKNLIEIDLYTKVLDFYTLIKLIKDYNKSILKNDELKGGSLKKEELYNKVKIFLILSPPSDLYKLPTDKDSIWLEEDRIKFFINRYIILYEYSKYGYISYDAYIKNIDDRLDDLLKI
jgi:hypothetical protein